MESSTIALIGLVLSMIGAIVGSFAYLMGEIRKVSASARRDADNNRDYLNGRIDAVARTVAQDLVTMRGDFVNSTQRLEADFRRISEAMVRRSDVDALEQRVVRSMEKLEAKSDQLLTRRGIPESHIRRGGVDD
jgi:hypothetical protein